MRLLYLMTEEFGVGGVQSDLLHLTEALTERGHQIYVATRPGVLLDELLERGANFRALNLQFGRPGALLAAAKAIGRVIADDGIDVIAPQSVRSTLAAYVASRVLPRFSVANKRLLKLPIITTIHNIHSPIHFKYGGWLLNVCSDFVIFESNYERDRLLLSGLSRSKSNVIHSGVDTVKFSPGPPARELIERYGIDMDKNLVFGVVARLSEEKGHCYLLEAFKQARESIPQAKLLIVGDGPLEVELKQQATMLGLDEDVIFAGMRRDIAEHLSVLDVFVLSSTRESFPLAAREAMAAGKAVIAPAIGGCPEVVVDGVTGYLYEAANTSELAERMIRIAGDRKWLEFGRNGRVRAGAKFSFKQWVIGDEAVYLQQAGLV